MKKLRLYYNEPAEDSDEGWEQHSLPLGCGRFGVSVFGLTESERLQVAENSVLTFNNLTDAAEIRVDFPHPFDKAENYYRDLVLNDATAHIEYDFDGVHYAREYFTSYPDAVLAAHFTSSVSGKLSFTVRLEVPFIDDSDTDLARTGEVSAQDNGITTKSTLKCYNIHLTSGLRVFTDGSLAVCGDTLKVSDATEAVIYFACDTNFVLSPDCFLKPNREKIPDTDPTPAVMATLEKISEYGLGGYDKVKEKHIADYKYYYDRAHIDLGGDEADADRPTNELLYLYRYDRISHYLEEVYYQYGRYMLISSSRDGELPPNLQGVWNCHKESPWGSGYWHNINIQMNYWPAFSTNLAELFSSYNDFNHAMRPALEEAAREYAQFLGVYDENKQDYGWTVGTAAYPYRNPGMPEGHSGPGMAGLTSKLFTDWWEFTRDRDILEKYVYPSVHGVSKSLVASVVEQNGEYLSKFSASPEQRVLSRPLEPGEEKVWGCPAWVYYHTVGCAFDQQMIDENGQDDLAMAEYLGFSDETTDELRRQRGHYHPVEIGLDGQIKEYREEKNYGDIGNKKHRHISQLVGLMPGRVINRDTPAWIDSARRTLDFRTDESTGWALAHRLNAWARAFDGDRSYKLFKNLIGTRTFDNLWDAHPPFQIDGNFGGTSGVTEMLLQSHSGYADILPSLPSDWKDGSFDGLVARGNFVVSVKWSDSRADEIRIVSRAGETLRLRYPGISGCKVMLGTAEIEYEADGDILTFPTEKGKEYVITDIRRMRRTAPPKNAVVRGLIPHITWDKSDDENVTYTILCATDSSPKYETVAKGLRANEFVDFSYRKTAGGYTMYKIYAESSDPDTYASDGITCVVKDER